MALTEKLTNIGNAIRAKTGKTDLLTLDEMPTEIQSISGGGGEDKTLFRSLVDRSVTRITAEDLGDITVIGDDAIEHCDKLVYLEIPETVTMIKQYGIASNQNLKNFTVPENCLKIDHNAFGANAYADWVKLMWREFPKQINGINPVSFNSNFAKKYLVRGSFFDEIVSNTGWSTPALLTEPFDEYVSPLNNKNSLFNVTQSISIPLQNYTSEPVYTITSTNDAIVSVSNFAATTEAITFDITSHEVEGTATINVSVNGAEDYVFNRSFDVVVFAEMEDSTYEVVPIEEATYGFTLNDDGYYESQNKGVGNSYAICRVNIHNPIGRIMYLDCINYAEANYDYGIIGKKDTQLARSNADDGTNAFYSFKGKSSASVQTVAHDGVSGDCFIEIKFRKDSSGDNNNDSLQFKIRFED